MKTNFIKTNIALGVISFAILGLSTNSSAFKAAYNVGNDTTQTGKDSTYNQNNTSNNYQKDTTGYTTNNYQKDTTGYTTNNYQKDTTGYTTNNYQKDTTSYTTNNYQKDTTGYTTNNYQKDTTGYTTNNYQKDTTGYTTNNYQKDTTGYSTNNYQKDTTGYTTNNYQKDTTTYNQNDTTKYTQKDTTYWNNVAFKDTTIGNSVVFNWEVKNANDKYCFQLALDSTFKVILLEKCEIHDAFIALDDSIFLNHKSDSTKANQRVAQAPVAGVYWRVGVDAGNNTIVWSAPAPFEVAKLTSVEDEIVVNASIYPNPVVENFTVSGVENIEKVSVINALGSVVKSFSVQETYNVAGLQSGIYIVEVKTANAISRNRIVVK